MKPKALGFDGAPGRSNSSMSDKTEAADADATSTPPTEKKRKAAAAKPSKQENALVNPEHKPPKQSKKAKVTLDVDVFDTKISTTSL